MDIGNKIKKSRTDAKISQEQAAEALGVSRQTLSNWENERSYPDIVSVLKMSDLYGVSLDYLLKGDVSMKGYLHYIEESTNAVKSKTKLSKLILILSYLVIWVSVFLVSWQLSAGNVVEALAGPIQMLVLPVATIVLSGIIGYNDYWGKRKWFAPIGFGLLFMLSVFIGWGMRESTSFRLLSLQTLTPILIGALASAMGMAGGCALRLDLTLKRKLLKRLDSENNAEDAEGCFAEQKNRWQ